MKQIVEEILNENIDKIILSNPSAKTNEFKKIIVKQIMMKDELYYQFEKFTQKQAFHENIPREQAVEKIIFYMSDFKQLDAYTSLHTYVVKKSKKEKIFVSKKAHVQEIGRAHV